MRAASVANSPEQFAKHVLELLALSPTQRRARAAQSDLSDLTWSSVLEPLWPILEHAASQGRANGPDELRMTSLHSVRINYGSVSRQQ